MDYELKELLSHAYDNSSIKHRIGFEQLIGGEA